MDRRVNYTIYIFEIMTYYDMALFGVPKEHPFGF